jgi:hypothetical protein
MGFLKAFQEARTRINNHGYTESEIAARESSARDAAARKAARDNLIDPRVGLVLAAAGGGVASVVILSILGPPAPSTSQPEVTATEKIANQPVQLTRRQILENIKVEALSWSKEGFGNVMVATFRIDNNNPVPIKDVQVTCAHFANSGSMIDGNTRIVYEFINANSYHYVRDMNMGFINIQAERSRCDATDFVG